MLVEAVEVEVEVKVCLRSCLNTTYAHVSMSTSYTSYASTFSSLGKKKKKTPTASGAEWDEMHLEMNFFG